MRLPLAALALTMLLAGSPRAQTPEPGLQTAHRLSDGTHTLGYLQYLPEGYAGNGGENWPLVLFLHGAGERGDDLDRVKVHGPPRLVEEGERFPFILISPQQPEGSWWSVDALTALLDQVTRDLRVDPMRVYVTGLSMGGYGTLALAAAHPERFAAIAPVCGGGDVATATAFRDVPTWLFHGLRDDVIPPERSIEMFEALRAAGAPEVGLTLYPDANHDSWTRTYANPDLFDWLLRHRRGG